MGTGGNEATKNQLLQHPKKSSSANKAAVISRCSAADDRIALWSHVGWVCRWGVSLYQCFQRSGSRAEYVPSAQCLFWLGLVGINIPLHFHQPALSVRITLRCIGYIHVLLGTCNNYAQGFALTLHPYRHSLVTGIFKISRPFLSRPSYTRCEVGHVLKQVVDWLTGSLLEAMLSTAFGSIQFSMQYIKLFPPDWIHSIWLPCVLLT